MLVGSRRNREAGQVGTWPILGFLQDFIAVMALFGLVTLLIAALSALEVTADELMDLCRRQLADYKVPRQIVFADELPTTPAGKIAKAALRENHRVTAGG